MPNTEKGPVAYLGGVATALLISLVANWLSGSLGTGYAVLVAAVSTAALLGVALHFVSKRPITMWLLLGLGLAGWLWFILQSLHVQASISVPIGLGVFAVVIIIGFILGRARAASEARAKAEQQRIDKEVREREAKALAEAEAAAEKARSVSLSAFGEKDPEFLPHRLHFCIPYAVLRPRRNDVKGPWDVIVTISVVHPYPFEIELEQREGDDVTVSFELLDTNDQSGMVHRQRSQGEVRWPEEKGATLVPSTGKQFNVVVPLTTDDVARFTADWKAGKLRSYSSVRVEMSYTAYARGETQRYQRLMITGLLGRQFA